MPSVVLIIAQDENGESVGQGSGFLFKVKSSESSPYDAIADSPFVQGSGLVATNLHVFTRASQAYVKVLGSGITYKVIEVVGIDMRRDLCVVRVEDHSTQALSLNSSNKPSVGDEVFVVSNPKGLEGSVSKGIVSGVRNDVGLIQIDAAISPGSSGGAVVNGRAEVIGIAVSSLIGGQNLNFAVPAEYLAALKLNFKVPVVVAGALSLKDRDKEKLKGLVRSVTTSVADLAYDRRSDNYFEKPAEPIDKSVYDSEGNEIERWFYGMNGDLFFKHFYTYDENGFKTRRVQESRDGTRKEYKISFEESVNEKVRDRRFSESTETPNFSKQVYDRDGNEIEWTLKLNTGLERHVLTYDRRGFEIEIKNYLDDKLHSITRSTYETDDHGNWIRRYETFYSPKFEVLGFVPSTVTYREITYFSQY